MPKSWRWQRFSNADLSYSTKLVDGYKWYFAAEIYKAFLHCSAKIIRDEGGEITAYDGDRIMAIFVGSTKNTDAVRSALKINYAKGQVINPALRKQYPTGSYQVKHVVGIDLSELHAARTGVRGDNDLVWVGRAANHAAKLSSLSPDYPTWITEDVYKAMLGSVRVSGETNMWEPRQWTEMGKKRVYCSTWQWRIG
jgi:class 3 adenylate cyclase